VFVFLLAGGALSCGISSQADTWSNKDYEVSQEVAAVINGTRAPLVVSHMTSRTLGLSYYLAPSVALRVRLHCDTCNVPAPNASGDLLAGTGRFDHVFLLGPPEAGANAPRPSDDSDSRFRYIDVAVAPQTPYPLGMFLSI
jgi:hypothetical protein